MQRDGPHQAIEIRRGARLLISGRLTRENYR